ncbi:hypothetical protein GQ600_11144 [Phytophthora cactorum]|nr:hypothetical protein GQ600_11144 [Phytophthora cactorum]
MGLTPAQASHNNSEEDMKRNPLLLSSKNYFRTSARAPPKSASQMAMLLNKPIISPRSELADCPEVGNNTNNAPKSQKNMSSLLQGLTFVKRSESDEKKPRREKKDKSKKRKKDSKKIKKKHKSNHRDASSSEEEDDENPKVTETKAALPRDEWMACPS